MSNFWGAVHLLGECLGEYLGEYQISSIPLYIGISAWLGEYGEGVFKNVILLLLDANNHGASIYLNDII